LISSEAEGVLIHDIDLIFHGSVDVVALLCSSIKRVTGNPDDHSVISAEAWFRTEIMKVLAIRKRIGLINSWRPSVGDWIKDRDGKKVSKTYDLWFQAENDVYIELKTFGRGGIEKAPAVKDLYALSQSKGKGWFIALSYPHYEHELERWDNQVEEWIQSYSGKLLLNRNITFAVENSLWHMKAFVIELNS
jgi:hypothetical protein